MMKKIESLEDITSRKLENQAFKNRVLSMAASHSKDLHNEIKSFIERDEHLINYHAIIEYLESGTATRDSLNLSRFVNNQEIRRTIHRN
jgi:hypothetical protein